MRRSVTDTGHYNVRANIQANARPTAKSIPTNVATFEDFGDVDLDDVVSLSLLILPQCIDACGRLGDIAVDGPSVTTETSMSQWSIPHRTKTHAHRAIVRLFVEADP